MSAKWSDNFNDNILLFEFYLIIQIKWTELIGIIFNML